MRAPPSIVSPRALRVLLGAALLVPFLAPVAPMAHAAATGAVPKVRKLAMVDLQAVLTRTRHGKRSQKKLETTIKRKQQSLDKERKRLESEVAKLGKLKGAALRKAQERLQQESAQWQQAAMGFEAEMSQLEGQLLETIYDNVQSIVKKIAAEQGIDLVIVRDQMTVIYTEDSLDITDEVVRRYDKVHK